MYVYIYIHIHTHTHTVDSKRLDHGYGMVSDGCRSFRVFSGSEDGHIPTFCLLLYEPSKTVLTRALLAIRWSRTSEGYAADVWQRCRYGPLRASCGCSQCRGKLFWLVNGGFKVSSGTVEWYRGSSGTDLDSSETAIIVM